MKREAALDIFRVVNPTFYGKYESFLRAFKDAVTNDGSEVDRLHAQAKHFSSGADYLRLSTEQLNGGETLIAPIWYAPPLADSGLAIDELMSIFGSIKRKKKIQVILAASYVESRMDKPSMGDDGELIEGEAIYAEIFAKKIWGADKVAILDIHSHEAFEQIRKQGEVDALNLTLNPMFLAECNARGLIGEETKIIAPDIGSLQRCIHFAELAGLDPAKHIVVLDKGARDKNRKTGELRLLYGELGRKSSGLMLDDIHDTGGTVDNAAEFILEKAGDGMEIWQFFTHGVLSSPADDLIKERLKRGRVRGIFLSDSLPQARFGLETDERIAVLPVASLMAWVSMAMVDHSVKELQQVSFLRDYILQPRDKKEVWEEFARNAGVTITS